MFRVIRTVRQATMFLAFDCIVTDVKFLSLLVLNRKHKLTATEVYSNQGVDDPLIMGNDHLPKEQPR